LRRGRLRLYCADIRNTAPVSDCQTAEIHIHISLMNRFKALCTAKIIRIA
jgi:hypothetical protein